MKITLQRDGTILADGKIVGRYQKFSFGGYEVALYGKPKTTTHYRGDIPAMVIANLQKGQS